MSEQNESSQDRNLPASEQKLSKAREKGQVLRSKDLSSAIGLGAGVLALSALGGSLLASSQHFLGSALRFDYRLLADVPERSNSLLFDWAAALGEQALVMALPILLACALGAIIGQLALGGPAFTTHPLMPDWSHVSPMKGLGRIFSTHNLMEFLKLVVIVTALVLICALYVYHYSEQLPSLSIQDRRLALSQSMLWVRSGAIALLGVLALAALIDAPLQWKRHHDQLMMTLQEVKQEAKESEGDPHVRARIKARQRELARSRMMAAVPKASVIVTNPSHFAVALQYEEGSFGAPKVVAKGVDLLAAKIREIGAQAGVPVLEAPPLARALYAHGRIGREVPPALYSAVAQVLAYIYQLRANLAIQGGSSRAPILPQDLGVPPELDPGVEAEPDDLDQSDLEDRASTPSPSERA
jgi:flagellar biosynthesis protein FlhB